MRAGEAPEVRHRGRVAHETLGVSRDRGSNTRDAPAGRRFAMSGQGRNRTGNTRIFRAFRQTVFSACFAQRNQLLPALREIAKHRDEVPKITVFARVVKTESGSYRRGEMVTAALTNAPLSRGISHRHSRRPKRTVRRAVAAPHARKQRGIYPVPRPPARHRPERQIAASCLANFSCACTTRKAGHTPAPTRYLRPYGTSGRMDSKAE